MPGRNVIYIALMFGDVPFDKALNILLCSECESSKGKSPSLILSFHLSLTLALVYLFWRSTLESQSTKDLVSGYET